MIWSATLRTVERQLMFVRSQCRGNDGNSGVGSVVRDPAWLGVLPLITLPEIPSGGDP